MSKNRFLLVLGLLSMVLVAMAVSGPFSKLSKTADPEQASGPIIAPVTGAEEAQPYIMDSATRSYIAWGKALEAKRNAEDSALGAYIANVKNSECRAEVASDLNLDSATRSYIAWGKAMEAKRNMAMDSATRSYIAWGQALQAARNAKAIDSGTRSYIAWGQALQAQGLMCR